MKITVNRDTLNHLSGLFLSFGKDPKRGPSVSLGNVDTFTSGICRIFNITTEFHGVIFYNLINFLRTNRIRFDGNFLCGLKSYFDVQYIKNLSKYSTNENVDLTAVAVKLKIFYILEDTVDADMFNNHVKPFISAMPVMASSEPFIPIENYPFILCMDPKAPPGIDKDIIPCDIEYIKPMSVPEPEAEDAAVPAPEPEHEPEPIMTKEAKLINEALRYIQENSSEIKQKIIELINEPVLTDAEVDTMIKVVGNTYDSDLAKLLFLRACRKYESVPRGNIVMRRPAHLTCLYSIIGDAFLDAPYQSCIDELLRIDHFHEKDVEVTEWIEILMKYKNYFVGTKSIPVRVFFDNAPRPIAKAKTRVATKSKSRGRR